MEREIGFYWVELAGMWLVASWTGEEWLVPGGEEYFYDSEFDSINEIRIENTAR